MTVFSRTKCMNPGMEKRRRFRAAGREVIDKKRKLRQKWYNTADGLKAAETERKAALQKQVEESERRALLEEEKTAATIKKMNEEMELRRNAMRTGGSGIRSDNGRMANAVEGVY